MDSLINGAPSATLFAGSLGTPFVSSFASPFSSPFNSAGFGQIGIPMFNNSFGPFSTPFAGQFGGPIGGTFGSPIASQFGGQFGSPTTPFASSPIGGFGFGQPAFGQPIWNQGFNTPFGGQFGFAGGQFGSPVTSQFGSFGSPFGSTGISPFGGQFNTPFASNFGGLPTGLSTGDWSALGGRFGSFSTPFGSSFGTPFGGQSFNQFGLSPWGFNGGINTGWTNGLGTDITSGFGGFSPIGTPFGGVYGQPISGGFTPWNSQFVQPGLTGFGGGIPSGFVGSPISGSTGSFNGFGSTSSIPGTPSYNGQGVGGYSPVSGGSPVNPITGNTTNSTTGVGTGVNTGTLNQSQPGFVPVGVTGYSTLPTQLVAGQFGNQGWNTPVGQPFNTTGQVFNGFGQPGFPVGFQGPGFTAHGNPSELRNAAGTTINVSQRDAA